jgi:hemerythrin-like domain-containing protein
MDIYEHLKQEHDQAKQLMEQLKEKPDKRKFNELEQMLEKHIGAEEKVVYKAFDQHSELHMNVLEAREEHRVAKRVLREVSKLEPRDEKWQAKFKVLKELIEHHVEEEESSVFPKAQKMIDGKKAQELNEKYEKAEERMAA